MLIQVYDTWGSDCNKTIFACNCQKVKKYNELKTANAVIPNELKIYSKVADYPILYLNVDENYNNMGEKVILVLKETYKLYKTSYSWYYMVDDDAYVFIENLNKLIAYEDPNKPLYYGHYWLKSFTFSFNFNSIFDFKFKFHLPYYYIRS